MSMRSLLSTWLVLAVASGGAMAGATPKPRQTLEVGNRVIHQLAVHGGGLRL